MTKPKPSNTEELLRVLARAEETGQPQCDANYGEISCGIICCSAAEMCMSPGRCVKSGSSPFNSVITPSMSASTTASETSRRTSSIPTTVIGGSASFTTDFIAPVATGPSGITIYRTVSVGGGGLDDDSEDTTGDGNHLSTGAIAGIPWPL
ncbi:hypothetical protein KEM54_000743 [Ascosphaera aggregata]|nr:hypothetical protein KEM54_000743 [Ascosphaera aggregata]